MKSRVDNQYINPIVHTTYIFMLLKKYILKTINEQVRHFA